MSLQPMFFWQPGVEVVPLVMLLEVPPEIHTFCGTTPMHCRPLVKRIPINSRELGRVDREMSLITKMYCPSINSNNDAD